LDISNMDKVKLELKKRRKEMRTKNVILKTKALEVIEGICLLDEKDVCKPFYRVAHVALGRCGNPHEDWRKELDKLHRHLVKDGVI